MTLKPVIAIPPRRAATVRISDHGLIFSREAGALLQIKPYDRLKILNSGDDPTDLYVRKVDGQDGYRVVQRHRTFCINSRSLARALKEILKVDKAIYRLGEQEIINYVEVTSIITRINYASTTKKRTQV